MTNINEINEIQQGGLTEELADSYNGNKVKIARFVPNEEGTGDMHKFKSGFKDGEQLPEGQFVESKCVYIETEPYGIDEAGNPLTVKQKINLKQDINGSWGFPTSDRSTAYKFKKMLKINKIQECIGREVIVVKTTYKDRPYMTVSIPN